MSGNVDGGLVGAILGSGPEGRDRTGQRCETYALAEQLLRHLYGDGTRGTVRLTLTLDEPSWARYRAEVRRPFRAEPRVTVVPVAGVGTMEFRRGDAPAFAWVCACGLGWPPEAPWKIDNCPCCGRDTPHHIPEDA